MKKLLIAVATLPFMAGVAAGKPQALSDQQMDKVTAGVTAGTGAFTATAIADALGHVGPLQTILTTASAVAQVTPFATITQGGTTFTVFMSTSASQSSSITGP